MKIFLICPVREADDQTTKRIGEFVENEEKNLGNKIHWPPRNTNQIDPIGLRICTDNAMGIIESDEIDVYWDKNSKGSHFDLGMAFVLHVLFSKERSLFWRIKTILKIFFQGGKKIVLVNPDEVEPTFENEEKTKLKKSYNNVLLKLNNLLPEPKENKK